MPVISVENCGDIGLIKDQYTQEMKPEAWSEARNFVFREGLAEKSPGHVSIYGTPQVPPYYVCNILGADGNVWAYAGLEKIYAFGPDQIHYNITRQTDGTDVDYTGSANTKWNGGVLSGISIFNNSVDLPQYWAGGNTRCQDLANWPSDYRCRVMRPYRNYLLALNVTKNNVNYPHLIKWSHVADPGTIPDSWDVTDTTKQAGEYDLADDQTELIDGMSLGEQFICYKRSGYWSVQYIGVPFIFRFQKISGLYGGALSVNCVTEFPGGHFVLGYGDVYIHQGGPPESVIDGRNRRWLFRQLDSSYQQRVFTVASPVSNELWICIPQEGADTCTLALIWNWKYNTWGIRELPFVLHGAAGSIDYTAANTWDTMNFSWQSTPVTWAQNVSTLPSTNALLASPVNEKFYTVELTTQFDGENFESYVLRDNIRFDKPDSVKLLKQVRPLVEGPVGASINVYVAAAYDQTADPTWYGPYPFRIGVDQKIDCYAVGRMLGIKFVAESDFPWRLRRYDLVVDEIGLY